MVFAEQKTERGFIYDCEDVFGTIHIESAKQLDAGILDDMTVALLRVKGSAQTVKGDIETPGGPVSYTFTKRSQWEDDNEETPCENTPTSTSETARESTAIAHKTASIFSWCRRFAEAFREAWKRGQPR